MMLRQYRTIMMAQMRRRIFRQMKQIEEGIATPMPARFVKYDEKDASRYPVKAEAVNCAVLP